jgi:hypothetical protein
MNNPSSIAWLPEQNRRCKDFMNGTWSETHNPVYSRDANRVQCLQCKRNLSHQIKKPLIPQVSSFYNNVQTVWTTQNEIIERDRLEAEAFDIERDDCLRERDIQPWVRRKFLIKKSSLPTKPPPPFLVPILVATDQPQKVDYYEYMNSEQWRQKSAKIRERDKYKCRLCYSPNDLVVHHATYERLGHEDDMDLITLCDPCHKIHHGIFNEEYDLLS